MSLFLSQWIPLLTFFFPQPWQDVFIYTVNFNGAIQTGIRLLVDVSHLPQNTLADQMPECVPPLNKKHSATAHDMLQSADVALDVHKSVHAVPLLDP